MFSSINLLSRDHFNRKCSLFAICQSVGENITTIILCIFYIAVGCYPSGATSLSVFSAPVLITGCVVGGIVYWGMKRNAAAEALQPIIDGDDPIIPVDNQ